MSRMKKIRIRHTNGTDLTRLFSAKLLGGGRGFYDTLALETFSNDITPTIKCLQGFTLIVEIGDEHEDKELRNERQKQGELDGI